MPTYDRPMGTAPVAVGARVRVASCAGGGAGFIAEDFGELPDGTVRLDRTTLIRPRRYAVALDNGALIFLDRADFATDTDE